MELLNYRIFSPEGDANKAATPLFILHGLLGSMDNWRTQAKRLSQTRTVITVDLRNHGDSPHIKGMSYREMYEDVIKVAQAENIKSFHLLGHSMGGKVAMQLALAHPEMVESLIVVDIAPKPYPLWHQNMFQAVMTAPIETAKSRQELDDHLKIAIEDRAERSFMLKNIKRNGITYAWKPNLKEISRGYLKIAGFTTALAQYSNKAFFIKGENSPYIQDSDNTLIQSLFPNSTITTIKNSGHLPHIQQKDNFFDAVSLFLLPFEDL
ncbi:MAG: alpha/beta fold hydrolase [Cocleimonas sp.]|nr:alpha/beta fold hydrolase [Cocleimonas sp.]